jgi:poly-gamma-glutamate synthesis protein (capsule biosynthesis protein)
MILASVVAGVLAALAPAAPAAEPAPEPPLGPLKVAVSGDILVHEPIWERALANGGGDSYDFRPMFRALRPVLRRADLALCHAETPLTNRPPSGYPVFSTPVALADAIEWAGFDVCNTASNHSVDQGQAGVNATIRALRRAGVRPTGTARSARGDRRVTMLEAAGRRVAFLAYTEHTNGIPVPHPWSVDLAEARAIKRDARRARRAGADVVIVNLHWGDEFVAEPSAFQRRLARRLTRGDAISAVVGQHAHLVQPVERVNGELVVFGLGNLLSNQTAACCPAASQNGLVAVLRFDRDNELTRVRKVPTRVRIGDYAVIPR